MGQTESTRQADWILPPSVGANGTSNAMAFALSSTAQILDLTSVPSPPGLLDPSAGARDRGPLGHYLCVQSQGTDAFLVFSASYSALVSQAVGGITMLTRGAGYTSTPAVAITGGGGAGATATATIDGTGQLATITLTAAGTGYTSAPTVTVSGGGATTQATAQAYVGTTISAAALTTLNAMTGIVTMNPAVCAWVPVGQTATFKLPVGSPSQPWGINSGWRFMGFVAAATTTGTLRAWQSSI